MNDFAISPVRISADARRRLLWPIVAVALVSGALIATAFIGERPKYGFALIGAIVTALVVTHPRLAVAQFLGASFVGLAILPDIPILLIDCSAGLLIGAALLDMTLNPSPSVHVHPLLRRYGIIVLALAVSGAFAFQPALAVRPILRLCFIAATAWAAMRLTRGMALSKLIDTFFFLAALSSLIAIVPFALTGGAERSFGLAPKILDDLCLLAVPMGVARYIWSRSENAMVYVIGLLCVFGGLVATQSRASIIFAVVLAVVVVILSRRRAQAQLRSSSTEQGHALEASATAELARRRCARLLTGAVVVSAIVGIVAAGLFEQVIERFDRLIGSGPSDTFRLRISLWKSALNAFADNPFVGIGAGNFHAIDEIYPVLRLDPVRYWITGLTAHNLLLHYLAETGLIGATALVTLFVTQYRLARASWLGATMKNCGSALALFGVAIILLMTTFLEAGWMWGQLGFVSAFFIGLIASVSSGCVTQSD